MPEFTSYKAGTPCWVDVSPKDAEAARAFYAALFNWEYEVGGADTGGYAMCTLRGLNAAGMMGAAPAEMPTVWTTYLATDDVDATLAKVTAAGGTVMMPAMDVMQAGRMAVVVDPTGAVVGLWQAGEHTGAQVANEPGGFSWSELSTTDVSRATAFYTEVFGYTYEEMSMGEGVPPYMVFTPPGYSASGGIMQKPASLPAEIPSFWMTYFSVADTDASVAIVEKHGGTVMMPPTDMPYGRFAVVMDPQGAVFTLIKPPTETTA